MHVHGKQNRWVKHSLALGGVAHADGETTAIRYFWGRDLSGTLQGAGGVGGLLYLTVNGAAYVPFYDGNGNVTRYCDANGNTAATYRYDAFDRTVSRSGPLADVFRHRFSTKYHDAETHLYYYGYRFYAPALMRWLNRDPIGEQGGENLYAFCKNNSITDFDIQGNISLSDVKNLLERVAHIKEQLRSALSSATECLGTIKAWRPGGVRDSDANDKYRHCVASCEIANACGDKVSVALGLLKEFRDVTFGLPQKIAAYFGALDIEVQLDSLLNGDEFADSLEDLTADLIGIDLKNAKGGCACACRKYYKP